MKLEYSQLSKKIYATDSKGDEHDVASDFINMFLLWIHEEKSEIIDKDDFIRKLIVTKNKEGKQIAAFEIQLTRID